MVGRAPKDIEDARDLTMQAASDLRDVPLWALWESADDFRRGKIGDGKMRPKTGQLRKDAKKRAESFDNEGALIDKVLSAPIAEKVPPMELAKRKEIAVRLRTLIADVK
jgi:hypothetical protein